MVRVGVAARVSIRVRVRVRIRVRVRARDRVRARVMIYKVELTVEATRAPHPPAGRCPRVGRPAPST